MEKKFHYYNLEGLELKIPLKKREGDLGYIEDISDLIDNPKYTPLGHPVIFTFFDPCKPFEGQFDECIDCQYFKKAQTEHFSNLGICIHEAMKCKVESAECRVGTESVKNE